MFDVIIYLSMCFFFFLLINKLKFFSIFQICAKEILIIYAGVDFQYFSIQKDWAYINEMSNVKFKGVHIHKNT